MRHPGSLRPYARQGDLVTPVGFRAPENGVLEDRQPLFPGAPVPEKAWRPPLSCRQAAQNPVQPTEHVARGGGVLKRQVRGGLLGSIGKRKQGETDAVALNMKLAADRDDRRDGGQSMSSNPRGHAGLAVQLAWCAGAIPA